MVNSSTGDTRYVYMSKLDWEENNVTTLFDLPPVISVLDVGCGLSLKSKYIDAQIRVGIDSYPAYFNKIESEVPYVVLIGDVRYLRDTFVPKSFDYVIALDVVEHLIKEEALEMIRQCEEIARKAVIIETPLGFVPQNIDILGLGGHEVQTHRSGWEVEEFEEMGYKVLTRPYTMTSVKRHSTLEVEPHITIIDAIKWLES